MWRPRDPAPPGFPAPKKNQRKIQSFCFFIQGGWPTLPGPTLPNCRLATTEVTAGASVGVVGRLRSARHDLQTQTTVSGSARRTGSGLLPKHIRIATPPDTKTPAVALRRLVIGQVCPVWPPRQRRGLGEGPPEAHSTQWLPSHRWRARASWPPPTSASAGSSGDVVGPRRSALREG